ncbi:MULTISPECIES: multidrug effflux MFS transporter [Bradyrhizobium]|uniref:multidrug effflux MFS transporter n=1 Tax=Bradyrhizobium TaxID=374 RepID=UPI000A193D51|nr:MULTISPECIES: multidrug effflux MFS transporter [Bradyrhizobium]OSI28832.1 Bcr/CflA family drug resistance efflux transporter [Bradyrhizobium canariense]OSI38583.1 Bcr/CflA family drug resistance efflux transporter [Bradyrhizobium canariense]OSI51708.1 Bcr/CflA family drug resistance efflux transporter [Bradyrhizobium canariense]OSI54385.1 Bcr/CflA family drug resistance efflux transporter [Bradyrhizobium canariense]WOH61398.1 multidrug effflux MFS transporter [Bradyrhizobium sp. BWC-3-1]
MTSNVENHLLARVVPLGLQVAVLAALSASGTLATNILLPSLPSIAVAVGVTSAQVTSTITIFLAMFAVGQLVVGPLSDRFGRRIPVMIGFAVFFAGSIWCALANDLAALLIGRVVQAGGACATSVLSRAIARDLFQGEKLARVLTFVMVAMAAAPGFSPLVGGALDHFFGWRSAFVFVGIFAVVAALAFLAAFGETHHAPRAEFDFSTISKNYWLLSTDRRFLVPAATVSLILGALFAMFSALPRVLIEGLDFTPMQLGLFFAGTVMIVFSAGIIATRIVPHLGLDRSICIGLALACVGGGMVLLFALFDGRFLPFLVGACVFLLGMGMVNPLCSAQALSPFGDRAGAASALLGFWQMLAAALGVSLAAVIASNPMIGLGLVLVLASSLASAIYQVRGKLN